MSQSFLSPIQGTMSVAMAELFDSFQAAYRDIHSAMTPLETGLLVSETQPPLGVAMYLMEKGTIAFVARKHGDTGLTIQYFDDETVLDLDNIQGHLKNFVQEQTAGGDYAVLEEASGLPVFSPEDELMLWERVRSAQGLSLIPESSSVDDSCDHILTLLGIVVREAFTDDELTEVLALAAAFAAAKKFDTKEAQDMELVGLIDESQLLAWAFLLYKAGRNSGAGAALVLGDLSARAGDDGLAVAEQLLARLTVEDLAFLQERLNYVLADFAEDADEMMPCRALLAPVVQSSLVASAPELFAWLKSTEGLTAWLRPDYSLLDCYPEEEQG